MMKKRFLCLFLAILTVLPLGACANTQEDPVVPTREFVLKENGASQYTVVFSRLDTYGEVSAAYDLYSQLGGSATAGLAYSNDSMSAENDANADAFEIIVGDCKREVLSKEKLGLKAAKDYVIYTENNRIYVYSEYFASLKQGVDDLISRIKTVEGKTTVDLPEKVYHSFDYPGKDLKINGNPISEYVLVVPVGSDKDYSRAEKINEWLFENCGFDLQINDSTDPVEKCEILIGNTRRAEDTVTSTLEKNSYKYTVEGDRLILAYNGYGLSLVEETLSHFENTSVDFWSVEGTEDAYSQFRYDNFADGRMSDELLDSVSPGVLAALAECTYFEAKLQEGRKKGQKWVYSNSSQWVPQSGTFDSMLASGKYGANCAMAQAWVLVDLGVIANGKHVWGENDNQIHHLDDYGKYMTAVGTIYKWGGRYTFKDLYNAGKIEAGDMFYVHGHTFMFLGDEKFMATGHDGKWHSEEGAPTEDSRQAVFDQWIVNMKSCGDYNYSIYWIYRFDADFVPKVYRNAAGKMVSNPLFDPANSMYSSSGGPADPAKIISCRSLNDG